MTRSHFERVTGEMLSRYASSVMRMPARVFGLLLLLGILSALAAVKGLSVNTDSSRMIDDREPFRVNALRYEQAFPAQRNQILIIVRALSADEADFVTGALVTRLKAEPDLFSDVFSPSADPFFRRQGLLFLDIDNLLETSDRLSSAAPMLESLVLDPSLPQMFLQLSKVARASEEGLRLPVIAAAYDEVADVVESLMADAPRPLSWQRMFGREDALHQRLISVQPVLDYASLQPARPAVEAVRTLIESLPALKAGSATINLTGDPVLRTEELKSVSNGIELSALLSLALVALLLGFGLRDWRYLLLSMGSLLLSLLLTAGFAAVAFGELNLVSIAFTVLLIGLGIDYAIHLLLAFHDHHRLGCGLEEGVKRAIGEIGPALILAVFTTSIAFLAFAPTRFVGMAQLGVIAGIGVLIAAMVALTVIPAGLALLPRPTPRPGRAATLPKPAVPKRLVRPLTIGAILVSLAALPFLTKARFDADPMSLRDPQAPSVLAFELLFDREQDSPYRLNLLAPTLGDAITLAARMEALPEVRSAITLNDFVPSDQDEKLLEIDFLAGNLDFLLGADRPGDRVAAARAKAARGSDEDALLKLIAASESVAEIDADTPRGDAAVRLHRALVAFRERAAADPSFHAALEGLLLRYFPMQMERLRDQMTARPVTVADLPPDLRRRFVSESGIVRIEALPMEDVRVPEARRRFIDAVKAVDPGLSGGAYSVSEAGEVVALSMAQASLIALLFGATLIYFMLRRLRLMLLILIPLSLAAIWTVAAGILLSMPFNFANVIVLPLLIGLGVDSAIHLVMRNEAMAEQGALFRSSTPRAVFLSALTTIGSFGTLALSSHRGTASMGAMLTIAILFTLVATLVILPGLLALFDGSKAAAEKETP